jgi:hypothetical protein
MSTPVGLLTVNPQEAIREALELNGLKDESEIPGYPDEAMIGLFLESTQNLTKEYGEEYVRSYRDTLLHELECIASFS